MEQGQWIEKSFATLITDAIESIYLAKAIPNPGSIGRFSRFAIMSCAVAIEGVANVCFAELPFSWDFISNLERNLKTLDKYELFLFQLQGKRIMDRGCNEVQRIKELIELRNDYVHPKKTPLSVTPNSASEFTVHCGRYNHLKIDKSYRTWKGGDGVSALRSVADFLNLFFLNWCKLEPRQITEMLFSTLRVGERRTLLPIPGEIVLFEKAKEWKIEFRFLDLDLLSHSSDSQDGDKPKEEN
jgi:hypothetical protein